jgi:hypothetical protein
VTFFTRTSISSPPPVRNRSSVGEPPVEEVEGFGVLLPDGGPHPAVVLRDELHQEVLQLRGVRRIGQAVVRDRGGTPDVVDPDDQRLDVGVGPLRGDGEADERHGYE